ncbi:MAG: NAD(P)-binding protein [Robiginitomaculum sp.]|nr:NAD(P)-binding protein [Robiginitomaculum sp.]
MKKKVAQKMSRRDFLNGSQIAIGAVALAPLLNACAPTPYEFALGTDYYPPEKTGLRGSHDGSWETMHAKVTGKEWKTSASSEDYDLVVVGGGISGLSAAYFYKKENPNARILILDNHDDFGGHAKRNEFEINGETRIGYGGTESIDTPSHYTPEAIGLIKDIGIKTERFYKYYDQELYTSHDLGKAVFFDKETFGEDKLVTGYGKKTWAEFASECPLSEQAKQDFIRVHSEEVDYMPGKTFDEKYAILEKTSYETFLRDYCKVDEAVINIYKRWGMSFWCIGIDEIPTTQIQSYDGGMPGVKHTLKRTTYRNDEPYIFHFPDGNASVARLIVRALIPEALPGSTMEDSVTARLNYSQLDKKGRSLNIRLNSTAVHVVNSADQKSVSITYVNKGKPYKVSAKKCVLACYNMAIPYLCTEMSESQKEGLAYGVKIPLVYTKVLVPNWKAFVELKTDFVFYTGGFFKQVELEYPVSIGDYKGPKNPNDPMVLHMCHVPWVPDVQGSDQWRVGRNRILSTSFETFENHVKTQLNQALGSTGFDADKDISAITVNRWPHGYAYNASFLWEPDWPTESAKPWVIGRQPFGNIHIANSDAGAQADTGAAITQAHRAIKEILS